jgi:OOP family OmpA-OmpF porin
MLSTDALFDFDKAVLRPAGHIALDAFVGKLKNMSLEVITVVGHTDRLGSEAYNQKLSERRAAAVNAFFVSKGIEPNRIITVGKGEMQPVTQADDCLGTKSAKVIACLQHDRRVDIEVVSSPAAAK